MPDASVLRQWFFLLRKFVCMLILKFAIRKATTGIDSLYFSVNPRWKPDGRSGSSVRVALTSNKRRKLRICLVMIFDALVPCRGAVSSCAIAENVIFYNIL